VLFWTAKMSRTSQLKELQDELRSRFDRGISEQDAHDQLKDDSRFGTLRLAKVSTIYKEFRSKQTTKPKHHKPAESIQLELPGEEQSPLELKRFLRSEQLSYFRSILQCNHKDHECLRFLHTQSPDGRFVVFSGLMSEEDNPGNFSLIDIFSNKTSQIKIQLDPIENDSSHEFYPLTYDMGLLIEGVNYAYQLTFGKISVNLLEFDWVNKKSQKLHTIKLEDPQRPYKSLSVIVDEMDSANFVLRLVNSDNSITLKHGNVVDKEILFKKDIQVGGSVFWTSKCDFLVDDKFYTLYMSNFVFRNSFSAHIIDLDRGTQASSFRLNQSPDHISLLLGKFSICIAPDRVFMVIRFNETQNYGIMWSKFEAQQWNELDFCVKEPITGIKFVGSLLFVQTVDNYVQSTRDIHNVQTTLYRIPLKKPEKLADLAWFNLVRSKSRFPNVDPYEEAHKYLPYTSEIRAPFEE